MSTITDQLNDARSIGLKDAIWAAITGIGAGALLMAAMMLYTLFLLVLYEVLVLAGVPMDEPSRTLLVLRFPVELPVFVALPTAAAFVMRLFDRGVSIRETAQLSAAVYAIVWVALLALGVETTWVF